MPGTNPPDDLPPDLPPEYAAAYRRGFDRAYAQRTGQLPAQPHLDGSFDTTISPPAERAEFVEGGAGEGRRRGSVAQLLVVALLLIIGAYGLGTMFPEGGAKSTSAPQKGGTPLAEYPGATDKPDRVRPYKGPLSPVPIGGADASCTAEDGVDAAGNPTSYGVSNVYDGRKPTAWRCDGDGVGETVTLKLSRETTIGEVGLVAGYAKTDPQDGSDRYAENNRITRVRWTFDDGTSITQSLDGSAQTRSMQTTRVPATSASSVTIEILDSVQGPRNTVAISGVELGAVLR